MTGNKFYILIVLLWIVVACHQGLAPFETLYLNVDFPILPEGGNPVGIWIPDTTKPVHVALVDPDQLPTIVDSLILKTELEKEGLFSFSNSGLCSVYAVLQIEPVVYLQGLGNPLVFSMNDTLTADGPYEIIDDKILSLYRAMDKMRIRFGDRAVMRASGMGAKSISRWNPFNGEPPPLLANRRQ